MRHKAHDITACVHDGGTVPFMLLRRSLTSQPVALAQLQRPPAANCGKWRSKAFRGAGDISAPCCHEQKDIGKCTSN